MGTLLVTDMQKTPCRLNLPDPAGARIADPDIIDAVRAWNEAVANTKQVVASPEFAAREELRAQLEALKHNATIRQSQACVSLLDDLAKCVGWAWARTDTASLVEPFAPHFKSESNRKTAIRRAEATAAADAKYREHLDAMSASAKPNQRITSLKDTFGLTRSDAHAIHRRWRDAQKRRTSAGSRQE